MAFHTYTMQKGSTGRSVLAYATDAGGSPVRGLAHEDVRAAFVRDDGSTGEIALVVGASDAWAPGGFVEIDADLVPGIYRLGIPDDVLATGATRVAVVLRAADARFEPFDIDLVAFDPQDVDRIGMESLAFEQRLKCLTTAFPLLAVEEQKRLEAQRAES